MFCGFYIWFCCQIWVLRFYCLVVLIFVACCVVVYFTSVFAELDLIWCFAILLFLRFLGSLLINALFVACCVVL